MGDHSERLAILFLDALNTLHHDLSTLRAELATLRAEQVGFHDGIRLHIATIGVVKMSEFTEALKARLGKIQEGESNITALLSKLIDAKGDNDTALAAVPDMLTAVETAQGANSKAIQDALDAHDKLAATNTSSTGSNGSTGSADASAIPVNTSIPTISGTAQVGNALSIGVGSWTNSPDTYDFQWFSGESRIDGATSATYIVRGEDTGKAISALVSASNSSGSGVASTAATATVGAQVAAGSVLTVTDPKTGVTSQVRVDASGNPIT